MSIDRRSHTPVYRQLASLIRDGIGSGQYPAGGLLPSEATLAQEYGVGRDAVRKALALLRAEGRVTTERGERSRVRPPAELAPVELSPGDTVRARMPDEAERSSLGVDEGVPIFEIHHANGKTDVLPADRTELTAPA